MLFQTDLSFSDRHSGFHGCLSENIRQYSAAVIRRTITPIFDYSDNAAVSVKILILGSGQVGSTIAHNLAALSNNDVTIIDIDDNALKNIGSKLDVRTLVGNGASPAVLERAGAVDCDMLLALTRSDETNMVACQVAYSLFNTPNRIARIRSPDYVRDAEKLFNSEAVPIDHLIAPEQLVIDNIYRLIEYPGALQVVNFAEGKVSLAVVKAYYGGPLIGNALSTMREHMPHIDTRVAD